MVNSTLRKRESEGFEAGKEEGLTEGREQGKLEEKLIIAKNLLESGMDKTNVGQITGLSLEQLNAVINKNS